MKIGETSGARNVGGAGGAKRTGGAKGADFSKFLEGEGGKGVDGPSGVAQTQIVGAVLGAQEVGDSTSERANGKARQRAEDMLERLEELRTGIVTGSVSRARLMELAQMARSRREAGADPKLLDLVGEIELRAEVELAKLSQIDIVR
jgi:hypothetical protein